MTDTYFVIVTRAGASSDILATFTSRADAEAAAFRMFGPDAFAHHKVFAMGGDTERAEHLHLVCERGSDDAADGVFGSREDAEGYARDLRARGVDAVVVSGSVGES